MADFRIHTDFKPTGDQGSAIAELSSGLRNSEKYQTLLGVTGSGKTFTMANIIQEVKRPTIVISHNKTLAAQLYGEFKAFFPENAVEYFISYYDYYQPEAYLPVTDTFIEKDSSINEEIDKLRLKATSSLLSRRDVIVVSSVSCIYGIGAVETYAYMVATLEVGGRVERGALLKRLVELQYRRNDVHFVRGAFRVQGDVIEIFPSHLEDRAWRLSLFGDEVEAIWEIDPLTGEKTGTMGSITVYANSHYVTPRPTLLQAIPDNAYTVALDREGESCGSEELSRKLARLGVGGKSRIAFVIGGAFGLGRSVIERADWRLSLSRMTFPHEMARLILVEQVYRALTIIRGEEYHK